MSGNDQSLRIQEFYLKHYSMAAVTWVVYLAGNGKERLIVMLLDQSSGRDDGCVMLPVRGRSTLVLSKLPVYLERYRLGDLHSQCLPKLD